MIDNIIISTHVVAGVISLLTGLIAIFAAKGKTIHNTAGKLYYISMIIIFITAILITVLIKFNIFLTVVAIFSFFMCFTGYRSLKRKKPNQVKWFDKLAAYLAVGFGLSLIAYGIYAYVKYQNIGTLILSCLFGFFLFQNGRNDIKHFKKDQYDKMWWWFHHLNFMLTSFIAVVTAFTVNNIYKVIDFGSFNFVFWIVPTIIILPFIIRWNKFYKKKFEL